MTNIPFLIQANQKRWDICKVTPSRLNEVNATAMKLCGKYAKDQYLELEKATGVPWYIIAVIHEREGDQNFNTSLAQGDPWRVVSRHVPRGRGPFKSFFDAGVDSLVRCPPYASRWRDWTPGGALTLLEEYNGLGYEIYHNESSPYNWGATNQEMWGKYTSDGSYSSHAWDTQLGCAAMLKQMMVIDPTITFATAAAPPAPSNPYDIKWVQESLNKLATDGSVLDTDGIFGSKTKIAVMAFQRDHGLTVDGIPGDDTIGALKKALLPLTTPFLASTETVTISVTSNPLG